MLDMTTDLEAFGSALDKYCACYEEWKNHPGAFTDEDGCCHDLTEQKEGAFDAYHLSREAVIDLFKEQQAEIKKRHTDKQVAACIEALKMVPLEDAREMMEVLVLATAVTKQDISPEAAAEIVKAVLKQDGFEV